MPIRTIPDASLTLELDAFVDGQFRSGEVGAAIGAPAPVCTRSGSKFAKEGGAIPAEIMSAALMSGIAE